MTARRVLVVDDNPKIREAFATILERGPGAGALDEAEAALFGPRPAAALAVAFRVEGALGGEEAVERVRLALAAGDPFGVAFVDIRMPAGWDGVRSAAELWRVDPRLQVVFCTAYSDHTWEDLVATLGVSDRFLVLKKPFDTIEVRQLTTALWQKWLLEREREEQADRLEAEVVARTRRLEEELRERSRAEGELQRAQKLDALGRMAAGLAHEINSPLTSVIGNLHLALDEALLLGPGSAAAAVRAALGDAAESAERIARIMRDVGTFARRTPGPVGAVDLRRAIDASLRLVGNLLRHTAHLEQQIEPLPPVMAEAAGLEQVLVNLLTNASQAIPAGRQGQGRIELVARRDGAAEVVVEIRDDGVGIAPEHLGRAFDPFFTTRGVGEGMGLGLPVSRSIVHGFGGTLTLESEPGRGTVARLRLRAAVDQRAAGPGVVAGGMPALRVLLVDDDAAVRRVIERGLVRAGIGVVACAGGEEALGRYQAEPFDLVLCDLMMPGVSGIDVYRRLAALGPGHAARLALMSGGVFTEDASAFLESTPLPVLRKPCRIDDILQLLRERTGRPA